MQHDDARGHLGDEVQVVLDQQAAQAVGVGQRRQHLADAGAFVLAETRGRLVQQHHARLQRQHHGQFQRLLLAMRQVARHAVQLLVQAGHAQHLQRVGRQRQVGRPAAPRRAFAQGGGDAQAFGHGQRVEDVGVLELAAQAVTHALLRPVALDGVAA